MTVKVLYVDDDDDIREIAVMSLELEPEFAVRACSSGEEAIGVLGEWNPDVVLLDVMMPGMDGPETLERMREKAAADLPPVLFCTARSQARDVDHYLSLGATGVISKPFDPMSLASVVKEHIQ